MNLIILGPQGSGKGTQAELLEKKLGLVHFEMGKILRSIANSDNEWAGEIKKTLNLGKLVPDELVRLIAWDFISKHQKNSKGIIFEGYPRSVEQYRHLQDMLRKYGKKVDAVIRINISKAETLRRLSGRRMCDRCGEIYNTITDDPAVGGRCRCGGKLVQREDDKPQAIEQRLRLYHQQTQPVFALAQKEKTAIEINGEQEIEKVHSDVVLKLKKMKGQDD